MVVSAFRLGIAGRHLKLVIAAVAAALVLPHAATPAAGADGGTAIAGNQSRTFVLVRTTDGASSFRLIVEAALSETEPVAFLGTALARVQEGRAVRTVPLGAYKFHFDYGVKAQVQGQTVQVCNSADGCIVQRTLASNVGTFFDDEGGPDVENRMYVTLEGPSRVRFEGSGWRLQDTRLDYRYLEASQAEASGVFTGAGAYQTFDSAHLAGGPAGSIALGTPPCSSASSVGPALVPRGAGTAVLAGGKQQVSLTCPENIGQPSMSAAADNATTWRMTGPVVGDSTLMNVPLFVVDLPNDDDLTRDPDQ